MWYEILPAFGITVGVLCVPTFTSWLFAYMINGKWRGRDTTDPYDLMFYRRDCRLTGNPYHSRGLEAIQDEPPQSVS